MPSSSLKGCPSVVDRSVTTILSIDSYDTASRKDGIPCYQELQHRYHGTSLLFTVSKLLKLKTSTYATSCTIFHRYCHQVSLREMNVWAVALASTVLATKIEEEYRPVQQIILMYARIYRRRRLILSENAAMICGDPNVSASKLAAQLSFTEKEALLRQISSLSPLGPVYDEWYKEFVQTENLVLRRLGFTLYWIPDSHPHKFILYFYRELKILQQEVSQRAWNYCNDSCRLDLCLRFSPEIIACTTIILAACDCNYVLPEYSWWHEFVGRNCDKQIPIIGNAILSLQSRQNVELATLSFLLSISGNAFNDTDSYLWSCGD